MLEGLPIYSTTQSKINTDMRTTDQVSDSKLKTSLSEAYETNENWNKKGLTYDQRVGQKIEKVWK